MSFLIEQRIRLYGRWVWSRFDRAADNPFQTQETVLKDILHKNQGAVFGWAHGFSSVRSVKDFRRRVPISDYEDIRPYVDRILAGEMSVLTAEAPVRFNITSGTTGLPKYIPVTREGLDQEINLIGQWFSKALGDHPNFLKNHHAVIVGATVDGLTPSGIPYGSASGMIVEKIPSFLRRRYAIPDSLFDLKDYDNRFFLMARCAAAKDISFLLTPNPSTLIRLAGIMMKHAEEIVCAVRDGKAGGKVGDPPVRFQPDPARAAFLERVLIRTGTLRPRDVWPSLQLISCWIGGCAGVHVKKMIPDYGSVPIRDCGYMASEAHITLPIHDNAPEGVLTVQTNFYEFIPESNHGEKDPPVLSCHELEPGNRYAILLTTRSGLYRYDVNDIVEVVGFYRKVPVLAFVRKGRDMTNITGEKVHANHFLAIMEELERKFGIGFEHYRAVPETDWSRYRLLIETREAELGNVPKEQLLDFVDRALSRVNVEYRQKRDSKRLRPLAISFMRPGWAEDEFRRFRNSGKSDIQFKWRVLCPQLSPEDAACVVKTIEKGDDDD